MLGAREYGVAAPPASPCRCEAGCGLRPRHYHIRLTAAAARTDQPLAPIEDGRFGAIPSSHLGRVGLDLVLAILAPNYKPHVGSGGATQRHRRAGLGLQEATLMQKWLDMGAALLALVAAYFWFRSASGELPPIVTYWRSAPSDDPFYQAVIHSAEMNRWAAGFSSVSALCMGLKLLFIR